MIVLGKWGQITNPIIIKSILYTIIYTCTFLFANLLHIGNACNLQSASYGIILFYLPTNTPNLICTCTIHIQSCLYIPVCLSTAGLSPFQRPNRLSSFTGRWNNGKLYLHMHIVHVQYTYNSCICIHVRMTSKTYQFQTMFSACHGEHVFL